ncbi:MAG: hypothetical protein WBQ61_11575 [Candidatus Acidiferrum sp.]
MLASILWLIVVAITLIVPVLLIWGWVRLSQDDTPRTRASTFSLLGFSLATASATVAIATHLYARFVSSFPMHDPTLIKIYACGCFLSLTGIVFGVAGTASPGAVRWLAPVCAFGTFVFWILAMSTQ